MLILAVAVPVFLWVFGHCLEHLWHDGRAEAAGEDEDWPEWRRGGRRDVMCCVRVRAMRRVCDG